MGIVNTFEKCLQSPYLFPDLEAPGRVGGLLAFAVDQLESARLLQSAPKGDQAEVIFLCYESMFACVRALVYARGYREAGMRCLLIACSHFYVVPDQLDPKHLHALERVQSVRVAPLEAIEAAQTLLDATRRLVQLQTTLPPASSAPASSQ